jgi:hypothetical protein
MDHNISPFLLKPKPTIDCSPQIIRRNSNSVFCNHNYEDEIHILFEWPTVVQVWRNGGLLQDVTATLHQEYNATTSNFSLIAAFA